MYSNSLMMSNIGGLGGGMNSANSMYGNGGLGMGYGNTNMNNNNNNMMMMNNGMGMNGMGNNMNNNNNNNNNNSNAMGSKMLNNGVNFINGMEQSVQSFGRLSALMQMNFESLSMSFQSLVHLLSHFSMLKHELGTVLKAFTTFRVLHLFYTKIRNRLYRLFGQEPPVARAATAAVGGATSLEAAWRQHSHRPSSSQQQQFEWLPALVTLGLLYWALKKLWKLLKRSRKQNNRQKKSATKNNTNNGEDGAGDSKNQQEDLQTKQQRDQQHQQMVQQMMMNRNNMGMGMGMGGMGGMGGMYGGSGVYGNSMYGGNSVYGSSYGNSMYGNTSGYGYGSSMYNRGHGGYSSMY